MEKDDNSAASVQPKDDQGILRIKSNEIMTTRSIPETDDDLKLAFILKSHSAETRRTYRTTLQTFASFCKQRHGRKLSFAEVTFQV